MPLLRGGAKSGGELGVEKFRVRCEPILKGMGFFVLKSQFVISRVMYSSVQDRKLRP